MPNPSLDLKVLRFFSLTLFIFLFVYVFNAFANDLTDDEQSVYMRSEKALVVKSTQPPLKEGQDYVSMELALSAAMQTADSRWDVYALGEPIPCSDIDGFLASYQFPVAVGTDIFPEILSPPPASQITNENLGASELWGAPSFWTIVVSARRSDYPVFVYYQGLPPLLVTYHKALEVAERMLDTGEAELLRYVASGRPGDFYVFSASDGQTVTLCAYVLRCRGKDMADIRKRRAQEEPLTPEEREKRQKEMQRYKEQVSAAWGSIEQKNK